MSLDEACSSLDEMITIDPDVRGFGVYIGYTVAWRTSVETVNDRVFAEEVNKLYTYLSSRYSLESLRDDPIIRAYRYFYWRIGLDPTKIRPSGEAIARRVLRNAFPYVNPVVDAGNIASAYTFVPIGLYDLDKLALPLKLVFSRGVEVFKPIGGEPFVVGKGIPILVDNSGKVVHIYPHRDSIESMVGSGTRRILILGAGVEGVPAKVVEKTISIVVDLLKRISWLCCGDIVIK